MKHKKSKKVRLLRDKRCFYSVFYCNFSAYYKSTHNTQLIYTSKNPPNVGCLRLEDGNSVVEETLAQGLVLWQ